MVLFMELHHYTIISSQILIVPFALYVCAMEKIPSGNPDTAFVNNCDHELAIWHVYSKYYVVYQCINMLHSINYGSNATTDIKKAS